MSLESLGFLGCFLACRTAEPAGITLSLVCWAPIVSQLAYLVPTPVFLLQLVHHFFNFPLKLHHTSQAFSFFFTTFDLAAADFRQLRTRTVRVGENCVRALLSHDSFSLTRLADTHTTAGRRFFLTKLFQVRTIIRTRPSSCRCCCWGSLWASKYSSSEPCVWLHSRESDDNEGWGDERSDRYCTHYRRYIGALKSPGRARPFVLHNCLLHSFTLSKLCGNRALSPYLTDFSRSLRDDLSYAVLLLLHAIRARGLPSLSLSLSLSLTVPNHI